MKKNQECTLTEEELKKLKQQICESLSIDRHALLCKFPFMGNLLLRMDLVPVRDKRVMTACTDGQKIFFSISFYSKLSNQERVFVLAHELMHAVLMHLVRCQTRIPDIYNIASDMEVNYCLAQQSSNGDLTCPPNLCFPPKSMQGKSAEVIYEWLMKKFKQQKKNGQKMKIPNGNPNDLKGQYRGWGSSKDEDDKDEGNTDNDPGEHGKDTGELQGQFDNHKFNSDLDSESDKNQNGGSGGNGGNSAGEDDDGDSSREVTDQWGKVGYDPDYQPKIAKDFADKMREAVIAEAQRCQRTQGHLPVGLEGILDALPKPTVDWKTLLCQFVTSSYGDKRQWYPPSRRKLFDEMYFQSRRSERLKIVCVVDTSGSCWGDLSRFFSELNSLVKTFNGYELTVIQADADVQDVTKYDDSNPFPVDDPKAINVNGCGGSDFRPAQKYIRENNIEHDVEIFVTDGFIDFDKTAPDKPALIVLTNDGNKECCDWGRKIVMDKDSNSYSSL